MNFFTIHCVLPKISHSLTPCAHHGGTPLKHLSTTRKLLLLTKNFSLLNFTNLGPFKSTYLADYRHINFFTIHCVLPKIFHLLTPSAHHGGAPSKHLSTTRKLLLLPKNFSLLSFTNLVSLQSNYLANYIDITFFRIPLASPKTSTSIFTFFLHGAIFTTPMNNKKTLASLKKLSLLSTTKLISLGSTCLPDYNDVNLV